MLKPGWYSLHDSTDKVAYYNGETWGDLKTVADLGPEIRARIIVLPGTETPLSPVEESAPVKQFRPPPPPVEDSVPVNQLRLPPSPVPGSAPLRQYQLTPPLKPGGGWYWGIIGGSLLIIIGLYYGYQPAGSNCGAPFKDSIVAELMDTMSTYGGYADECREAEAAATGTTWTLIILGALVALASALIMATIRSGNSRSAAPPAQTMASKIEDLARLRDQGLVTAEEYEWKRQELLRS